MVNKFYKTNGDCKMKKQKIVLAGLTVAALIVGATKKCKKPENINSVSDHETEVLQSSAYVEEKNIEPKKEPVKNREYSVKEYDGCIAVFEAGSTTPFRKTEISVKSLPEADQKILKNGIKIESGEELDRVLEDYLS